MSGAPLGDYLGSQICEFLQSRYYAGLHGFEQLGVEISFYLEWGGHALVFLCLKTASHFLNTTIWRDYICCVVIYGDQRSIRPDCSIRVSY